MPGSKLETSCGSLAYSAPEILLGDSYDGPAVDVWSLGVILCMLVVGEPPFQEANDSETLIMIMDCKYSVPPHVSGDCRALIDKMLQREPDSRATLDDIMNHTWLTEGQIPPIPLMPLVSREDLSEEDQTYIIRKMVEGKIATSEKILEALESDKYNHVSATYYLLAERLLKKHHEQQAHNHHSHYSHHHSPQHPMIPIPNHSQQIHNRPSTAKANLAPLALSPRNKTKQKLVAGYLYNCECDDPSEMCE